MRVYLIFFALTLGLVFSNCEVKTETGEAISRSSVAAPGKDQPKLKVDSETKEQIEDSQNDDKQLEKQEQEAKSKDESDESPLDDSTQEVDDSSGDEAPVENANDAGKEDDKGIEEDDSTTKRADDSKDDAKNHKKFLGYRFLYPGGYLGNQFETGGPYGFHPGSIWEYPYPYVHPMYPSPFYPCMCSCKDDKEKEKDKKEKEKKTRRKQLVPSHYYGPPSAGWGAYQPGHDGAGWGAPYWYKSYIPSALLTKEAPKSEHAESRHTINDGLDFGMAHTGDSAHVSYGGYSELGLGAGYGAGWHDGYTDHPIYGTYGGAAGRTTFVDPIYGDLENSEINGWGHGVGRPYLPYQSYGHAGVSHGHLGHQYATGHPYIPTHAGLNAHAVHNGGSFYGPHTAMLPTAQGHIQFASSGHTAGMGGHNLGGFADRLHNEEAHEGDFVGGIHADLSSHYISGHHHDHAAAGHTYAPFLHTNTQQFHTPLFHTDGLDGDLGDHFGQIPTQHIGHTDLGMVDHFGPIIEHTAHAYGGGHLGGGHGLIHGLHGHNANGANHRVYHNFGAHLGHHVGVLGGPIGDGLSASHLFGGVHKSGVPLKHKHVKKHKRKMHKNKP